MTFNALENLIGNTPLVKLQKLGTGKNNTFLVKLEGQNPGGSVKDRAAYNMIMQAHHSGLISTGDRLIEATSGNTGIALAMVAAAKGYKMTLIMSESMSAERRASMKAYGADVILVDAEKGIEGARDLALEMQASGQGLVLNQFANANNPDAHYKTTGPEIWRDTEGAVTHFVSSMGTTGTIMGTSRYLKEKNNDIQIIGVQPTEGSSIPGIRRWPKEYLPTIFEPHRVDQTLDVSQQEAEETMRLLGTEEGIFCGVSSGGAAAAMFRYAENLSNAVLVSIVCDRGDRYISTGIFPS